MNVVCELPLVALLDEVVVTTVAVNFPFESVVPETRWLMSFPSVSVPIFCDPHVGDALSQLLPEVVAARIGVP